MPILPRMDTVTYIDIAAENPFSDVHPALRSHVPSHSRSVSTSSSDSKSSSDSVQISSSQPDSVVIKRNLPYRDPSNRNSSVSVRSIASFMTSRDGGKSRYSSRFIIEQSQSYKKSRCQEERYNKVVQQLAFAWSFIYSVGISVKGVHYDSTKLSRSILQVIHSVGVGRRTGLYVAQKHIHLFYLFKSVGEESLTFRNDHYWKLNVYYLRHSIGNCLTFEQRWWHTLQWLCQLLPLLLTDSPNITSWNSHCNCSDLDMHLEKLRHASQCIVVPETFIRGKIWRAELSAWAPQLVNEGSRGSAGRIGCMMTILHQDMYML